MITTLPARSTSERPSGIVPPLVRVPYPNPEVGVIRTKTLIVAAALTIATAACLCSSALAAPALTGTFEATVSNARNPSNNGTFEMILRPDGTVEVLRNGKPFVTGDYSAGAAKITFAAGESGPRGGCPGIGRYRWKLSRGTLRLTQTSDTCKGREGLFKHPFTEVSS